MKNTNTKIYVQNGRHGLDVYLDISGTQHYLGTRRRNGLLYTWLKDGKYLSKLARVRPGGAPSEQKIYHYSQYLLKLVESFFEQNIAAC